MQETLAYEPNGRGERRTVLLSGRIDSLDVVRGVAMALMAIDHVRVYAGVPPGGPTAGLFFTRWITNFVAPIFVFLAGTSAYLYGMKSSGRGSLSRFLSIRGLWLIFLELTVLRLAWTFNFDYPHYLLAGVIWMIGWSMICLAAAVYLPNRAVAAIGISMIVLHNVSDLFHTQLLHSIGPDGPNWLARILYFGGPISIGESGPTLFVLYDFIPWIGLMFAGYAFGPVATKPSSKCTYLRLGVTLTGLFVALRLLGLYGDPRPWDRHTFFSFLNTTKYPASLEYLLMTVGPMFLLWYAAERWMSRKSPLAVFGRVPMFYYLLHIPLIHAAACLVALLREGQINPWLFGNHPVNPGPVPHGYTWSLGLLYGVYAACLSCLYLLCRWYSAKKAESPSAWLKFL